MQTKFNQGLSITFLFILSMIKINAQTTIGLEDALSRMESNNLQIKISNYNLDGAREDVEQMKSIYLPQISLSATGMATNTPLNAFGTKLQQGAIMQSDFIPDDLNAPSSITNLNTQLMVRQPIFNTDARAMKKAMDAKSKSYGHQLMRTKEVLKNQVVQAYLNLQLMYEMHEVLQNAKNTSEANLKLANDNYEAGYLQYSDVLMVKVHVNEIENQLFQVTQNIANISDQLSFLMGSEDGVIYKPDDELAFSDESAILSKEITLNRSDFKAVEGQVEAQQYMLDAAEKAGVPRLNAFASYDLNNSLDFAEAQHGYMVGVQASWDIFNGNRNKSAARKAKVELDKSRTQLDQMIAQSQLEFETTKRLMLEARQKMSLAETAIEQSKESLRIKTDRFAEGLEKTTDILVAETTLSQKEMEYVNAVYQYQNALATLRLLLEQ